MERQVAGLGLTASTIDTTRPRSRARAPCHRWRSRQSRRRRRPWRTRGRCRRPGLHAGIQGRSLRRRFASAQCALAMVSPAVVGLLFCPYWVDGEIQGEGDVGDLLLQIQHILGWMVSTPSSLDTWIVPRWPEGRTWAFRNRETKPPESTRSGIRGVSRICRHSGS